MPSIILQKKVVHIVGPYAGYGTTPIATNVARARALAALAVSMDLVPVVPHLTIGEPAELLTNGDARARQACYGVPHNGLPPIGGLTRYLAESGCNVWGILRDDGSASPGTQIELDIHATYNVLAGSPALFTWSDWKTSFTNAGLVAIYDGAT